MENIKHYGKHLGKLKALIHSLGMKLEFKPLDCEGVYNPARRKIQIDDDLTQGETIASILHELGHLLDDLVIDYNLGSKLAEAYNHVYKPKSSKKHQQMVLQCEKRAWVYAEGIAHQLKIPLGKWYHTFKSTCLKSYKTLTP